MKIAVVGGGISGLSAALILSTRHEVHLFESDSRLGGHAHTVSVDSGLDDPVSLDTGFLVYNNLTYPHFSRFLDYLGVQTAASDMTLSIKTPGGIEWGGANLRAIFAQWRNFARPSFLGMLVDIVRFNKNAHQNLELSRRHRWTLGELIQSQGYGETFQTQYLLPMTGAIWSMSYANALQFPAETFLTFCINHHLLQINGRPTWRTINGGSINYVNRVRERLPHVHSSSPVRNLRRRGDQLILTVGGQEASFDKVVLATHAPTSREILQSDFPDLAVELSPLRVTPNRVDLHEDASIMPKKKVCWSAWNVRAQESPRSEGDICLTYFINKLQPLESRRQHFVTLNSRQDLRDVQRQFRYDHPQFDFRAIDVQQKLPQIQGRHGVYFAGAWTRYGFHEDGILSAVNVSRQIGVEVPW